MEMYRAARMWAYVSDSVDLTRPAGYCERCQLNSCHELLLGTVLPACPNPVPQKAQLQSICLPAQKSRLCMCVVVLRLADTEHCSALHWTVARRLPGAPEITQFKMMATPSQRS